MQIAHVLQSSYCTKMSSSPYFQLIKLHREGEKERSYLQMIPFPQSSCYRNGARKCAQTQVAHWWQSREDRWQVEERNENTHREGRILTKSGCSQGEQTDLVGRKQSETPPFRCFVGWKYSGASRDILQEVVFQDHYLSLPSSALTASTPLHRWPMSTRYSHRVDESSHSKPNSAYHQCLGSLQSWPGDPPSGLKCLRLEGIQPLSALSALRAENKNLPSLSARTEAQYKETHRQQHSMESPDLGLCA